MNIGKKLKALREENHLTQQTVAKRLGITQGTYAIWEQKETNPTLETLKKFTEIYDVSLQNLLGEKREPQDIIDLIDNYKCLYREQKEMLGDLAKVMVERNASRLEVHESPVVYEFKTYHRNDLYEVKIQDEELSAGFGTGVKDNYETYTIYTDTPVRRYDSAARIKGESMEPDIPNESIVTFVNNGFDIDGDIYVISEGGYGEETLYCKQVYREEDSFRCHSLNPDPQYKDFYLSEDARILGAVLDCVQEVDPDLIES
ncbi:MULTISPECIES: helix-turn-helix domain-containing protein [Lactococcus]|uniref:Transcriptional regulator n=1 Tax=Lactococcus lactis subsp. lactis TaxID=1360 RepID=A0A1V0NF25_LACLL|nr:XRE family transcriptional regulator [Lactococcus lactis]ARD98505.1 transcriptional regulator [Lactococcus lactis subsp. lactis]MDS1012884.1 XRE family transcriptional regulator [Lactococcus lactis]NLS47346.1 helix-turn-helix domain-containing protein [Lactococcus lactis]TKD78606.1 helix-turn-helix transcriptional regulator [Lactococcus lactis]UXV69042.1 XRE family transcriptional regulator [Lactococcus lactis subsp. lactis]